MEIKFFRGNDHEVKFRFPKFNGSIEKVYFTVKCGCKIKRLQKTLGNGIELVDDYYVVTFLPDDTENLMCDLAMKYDIKIITNGKKYTVHKNVFKLEEEVTTSKDEV